jgi:SAM-dependent methyltransferase
MRLDKLVHSKPDFYSFKLKALSRLKRATYKLLGIDGRVEELRRSLDRRNNDLLVRNLAGKAVLEVGCGRGDFLAFLQKDLNCKCVGVDISEEMISSAEERNPGPAYRVMDSANLDFDNGHFDFVVFNYVLHHIKDLDRTVAEAKRVGRHIVLYECCTFDRNPLKLFSRLYWKITDGGYRYKSLDEWKQYFALECVEELRGQGLVRYGMCVLKTQEGAAGSGA